VECRIRQSHSSRRKKPAIHGGDAVLLHRLTDAAAQAVVDICYLDISFGDFLEPVFTIPNMGDCSIPYTSRHRSIPLLGYDFNGNLIWVGKYWLGCAFDFCTLTPTLSPSVSPQAWAQKQRVTRLRAAS
jgi:hypothetical protein